MSSRTQISLALSLMALVLFVAIKGILIPSLIAPTNFTCEGGVERSVEMFSSSVEHKSCNTNYVPTAEERAMYQR